MTPASSPAAQAFTDLMAAHRSVRRYKPDPIDPEWLDALLMQALHGSSSSGNLNTVSVVKTRDPARKARLCELHFGQPMVKQAPLVLTFCADTHRTRQWLALRGARPGFADFISWHVAAFDAVILAQTAALALESHGLGICYMGTTLHHMREIADFLEMPANCLPVTSLVVGWPDEQLAQRDRLPTRAWLHDERYTVATPEALADAYAEREQRGRQRYMELGEQMAQQWREHGLENLAQYYTSPIKYDPDRFRPDSEALEALLRERGFLQPTGWQPPK